jgi:hypothetical protein
VVSQRNILRRVTIVSIENEAVGLHGSVHLFVEFQLRVVSLVDEEVAVWDLRRHEDRKGGEREEGRGGEREEQTSLLAQVSTNMSLSCKRKWSPHH